MVHAVFQLLADQPFATIFLTLGAGYVLGRLTLGFFSLGSTAGSLLVALLLSAAAFQSANVTFTIPELVGDIFLSLFTYAVGLRVGPQFVDGLRRAGVQLIVIVVVTTTVAFVVAYGGCKLLGLAPGFAPGILAGSNTISAVMGVATSTVTGGLYHLPAGLTAAQIKANIAAGYSLTYIFSILGIVLLVRNLPGMFGIDPVAAAKVSEKRYGGQGHALPGTSQAFTVGMLPVDVRVYRLENRSLVGRTVLDVSEQLGAPILRLTRNNQEMRAAHDNPVLESGDLLTVGGRIEYLLAGVQAIGPEIDDEKARHFDVDQAEIVLVKREFVGKTLAQLARQPAGLRRPRARTVS